ncbi:MAG: LysR family transcriptional regulator [Amphritea sp.]|nr:LysR family transcriptional regulator [Amphritea sp.]
MKPSQLLDSNLLHNFVVIAESQSLTDAALRLNVTQPAVSQCLRQLEQQIGTELVVRRTKPVQLTAAGDVLKKHADTILGDLRRLSATVREAAQTGQVKCRLGLVTSCSEIFGSKLLAGLSSQTQQLIMKSGLTTGLHQQFLNRDIDILISDLTLMEEENLLRFSLIRDPMLLAIPERYYSADSFSLKQLAAEVPMIKYSRTSNIGGYSEVVLRRMQIKTNIRYETDDTHTLMSFVKDGHGWAILSGICLSQVIDKLKNVRIVELDNSRHYRDIYLVSRKGELGSMPEQVAESVKAIFFDKIFPSLKEVSPWMTPERYDID